MLYHHVVCRDCRLEAVLETREEALELWAAHGEEQGHQVRCVTLSTEEDAAAVECGLVEEQRSES